MESFLNTLKALSSAEDFLGHFGVPYDPQVVHVNRLHILKRFTQYLHRAEGLQGMDEVALFRRYRELLMQAYRDFVRSTPAQEKVFKVFQEASGVRTVSLESVRDSLALRR